MLAALLVTTAAANAQESFHPKTRVMTAGEMANLINPVNPADPEAGLPLYKRTMMPPAAPTSAFHAIIRNPPPDQHLTPVVMNGGMGGLIGEHTTRFWALGQTGAPVEMRGGCWSACTMITGFVPKERLCFAPGAFLAFHAARTAEPPYRLNSAGTWTMYASYPAEIRQWIDHHGGVYKLTVEPSGPCTIATCGRSATRGASDPDLVMAATL
jgi:hypothetical protein